MVHGGMDFHFCHGNASVRYFSVNLTYLVTKNHNISSRGQKLKNPQPYFRRRCKLHWRVLFLRNHKLVSSFKSPKVHQKRWLTLFFSQNGHISMAYSNIEHCRLQNNLQKQSFLPKNWLKWLKIRENPISRQKFLIR